MKKGRRALRHFKDATTFERIYSWYVDPEVIRLTDKEKEKKNRYVSAFSLLLEHHDQEVVVPMLVGIFRIDEATAYRDIKECKQLFCDINSGSREAEKFIILQEINKAIKFCWDNKDMDNYHKHMKLKTEIQGFDKEESDEVDLESMERHNYILQVNPALLNMPVIENLDQVIASFKKKKLGRSIEIEDIESDPV